ncbi:MAG: phosphodiester glycosidase family protein [Clostridia bacterium]|nr:phosphodiester glycosidase family protein [Clostridia bacterium]MBQ8615889.1 phosphodiester glycosidase family protein [Clostridia bacterium]
MIKRILCLWAILLLVCSTCLAEGEFPQLNAEGYLDEGEFVYANEEEGVWRYASQDLKIEIIRRSEEEPIKVRWYEAEVWSRNDEVWRLFTNEEGKHMSTNSWPYIVAQKNQAVLAISTDFAQYRYPKRDTSVGIIIRNGKVFSKKTRKSTYKGFPNLDVLALYPDGRMEVYDSDEKTADEYLAMGVTTTLAFGPYLIRDGVINTEGLAHLSKSRNPRAAIGMVEPGHTFAMMLEGRCKESKGGTVDFLAEKMLARGCTTAFNLDGGETACILFMGEQLNIVGGANNKAGNARRTTELLGIGVSEQVPKYE